MSHTRGPLVVQPNGADGFNIGIKHPVKGGLTTFIRLGGSVAHRSPISLAGRAPIETQEALANGRLWSVSPQLLDVVKLLLDEVERLGGGDRDTAMVVLAGKAAVAKAEGDDPLAAIASAEMF